MKHLVHERATYKSGSDNLDVDEDPLRFFIGITYAIWIAMLFYAAIYAIVYWMQ